MKNKKLEQKNYELSRKIIEKAGIYYDQGNLEEAAKTYEEAFNYFATVGDILEYAMIKMEQGDKDKALELIDNVIEADGNDFRPYYFKGVFYEYHDDDEEALKYFIKAKDLLKKEEMGTDEAIIYFKIGRIYDDLSDKYQDKKEVYLENAKEYYNEALKINPHLYYANLNLGSIYEKENVLDKALELMKRAHEDEKNEKMSAYNLGVIYAKLKDYDKAIKYYEEEITKKDFYPYAYYNLGILYKDVYSDYNKAKECYIEGLKYLKDNASLWYNLGCIYTLLNDFKNATDCFYYSISLKPEIMEYMEEDSEINPYVINREYQVLKNKFKK